MEVDKYGTITYSEYGTEHYSVSFNEYNKKTKKQKQIKMDLTAAHKREIQVQVDSTDSGEFYRFEDDKKIVTGYFTFTNSAS